MAEEDNRTEDERIQAILQQNNGAWSPPQDQFNQASPPPRNIQMPGMSNMNHGIGTPDMFNPMMAMNGPNMLSYQQQMQMQQFLMQQQQQQQQQMSRNQNMQPGMRQSGQLPPESQPPPAGYVCYKCNQPGHWIYYCPNVPKGVHVRAGNNGTIPSDVPQSAAILPSQANRVPLELLCRIDNKLMKDAVLVPCCGKSFCRECIKSALASNPRCPSCGSTDVDANRLIPNKSLRNSIQKYKDEHGDPDEQPTELPTTQEPTNAGNEEQEIPKDTEKVDNTPSNDDQAPNEAPQSPPKRNTQPARQYPTSGMPIQVFQSEERVQKNKPYNKQDDGHNDFPQQQDMMEQNEFFNGGGSDMPWMGMMGMPPNMMGVPPGMNPAMMAGMMGMGMPPPGGFPGFFPGPGGFPPPFPPPEMFGFPGNMNLGRGRGGFGGRGGRGGSRGGAKPSGPPPRRIETGSNDSPSTPTRQDMGSPTEHKEETGDAMEGIPTGPRADRDRTEKTSHYDDDHRSSRNRHSSRSRSPRRHESGDRQSHHYSDRHHSRSTSKHNRHDHDSHYSSSRRRSRSRRSRSPSERRSRSVSQKRSRSPSKKRSSSPTGSRHTDDVARPVDSVVESVLDNIVFDEEPAPPPSEHDRKEHDSGRRSRDRSSSRSRSSRSRHRDSRDRDRDRDRERERDRDRDRDNRHHHRSSDHHSRRQRSRDRH